MEKNILYKIIGAILVVVSSLLTASFGEARQPECIVPSKMGGAFDLTCKLIQQGFKDSVVVMRPIRIVYMPGSIGADAYQHIITERNSDVNTIIAFSSGSLLNIAEGKFGTYNENSVKWLSAVALGYGVISVKTDSNIRDLDDLVAMLQEDPKSVVLGGNGGIGSQDWLKIALLSKAAGLNMQDISYVPLDGGGEIIASLYKGDIDVMSSGVTETTPYLDSGDIRILAVLADKRVEGRLSNIPTAKEQGYDVVWPIIHGFYMGPNVTEDEYNWWKEKFNELLISQEFQVLLTEYDFLPFSVTGEELKVLIEKQIQDLRIVSEKFGLLK
ncbi:Bug family tripartite tricarboxylate transporter substrate binding protein [Wohlfahrtiimonas populi]|uniref:Bug family tripartite tricarboxylate transporter substrate binding protein n=1 Tax=Wohlfahrtiimonas populi TaxID=1940240 RepID=UPI00098D280F|nr:tripartite tricarboxylate transporter substrate-binding protein [Wohlfahrtiimonas populi]